MRRILVAVLIGLSVAGATALAQEAARPQITWDREPDGSSILRRYPERAVRLGVEGGVVLCCTVARSRRLDCDIAHETPAGYAFGDITRDLFSDYRVSRESYDALRASGDMSLKRSMRWLLPANPQSGHALDVAAFTEAAAAVSCPMVAPPEP
jgi:hypothetical protein